MKLPPDCFGNSVFPLQQMAETISSYIICLTQRDIHSIQFHEVAQNSDSKGL
jgi:hypothetical protein